MRKEAYKGMYWEGEKRNQSVNRFERERQGKRIEDYLQVQVE